MYRSMHDWLTKSCDILKFDCKNVYGDSSYKDKISAKCLRVDKFTKIVNTNGEFDVSSIQLYVDSIDVTTNDVVILDGIRYPIKGLTKLYENATDYLEVIYL